MVKIGEEFIKFCIKADVLRFGSFKTKAGRQSPYFFDTGLFNDGEKMLGLASFYALSLGTLVQAGEDCDMIFGPAYKGIPLVACTSMFLAMSEVANLPFCFNRKEAKDHGEGGTIVGAPLKGKVAILDDVISAGTSIRESVEIIKANGATPSFILIALDRMEKAGDANHPKSISAIEDVAEQFGIPVFPIATLEDLLNYLKRTRKKELRGQKKLIEDYLAKYGCVKPK